MNRCPWCWGSGAHHRGCQGRRRDDATAAVLTPEAPAGKWDHRAVELATTVAGWSSCWRDMVGAVVMSPDHDVVATGFNDTPRGWPNCNAGGCRRASRTTPSGAPQAEDEVCLHAEDNALQRAGLEARGATLVVTREPCAPCLRRAYTAGIARVVVRP